MAFNKSKQQTNLKGAESTIIVITFNGVFYQVYAYYCYCLLPLLNMNHVPDMTK